MCAKITSYTGGFFMEKIQRNYTGEYERQLLRDCTRGKSRQKACWCLPIVMI